MNQEIRDIFDRIAPVYDELNNWLSLGQHRIWKEMTVKWSAAKPGDTCLDLCCGSGDLAFRLAKYVGTTGKVYGVDFSPNLLAAAKERSQSQYPQPTISWIEADALDLPFDDHYFDAATMGPRNPQLRAFQQWYLSNIVVPIANRMGLKEEYAYISPSLDRFPTGQEQIELARQVGFTLVTHYPIANDMMGVLVVSK
jgi:demethylphylloquinol methyltransferase